MTHDPARPSRYTLVAFHAHPDDEALLTGGTLAKAAAQGHRVVLVTATNGERGLAGRADGRGDDLARLRLAELETSAAALGCARVVTLGYGDSGLRPDPDDLDAFAHVDVEAAARRLADLL
ncbi:MAG: PIG-L deacetylase family protein, partial [Nocardioides sp.]